MTESTQTEGSESIEPRPGVYSKKELARVYRRSTVAIDGWMARGCPYIRTGRTLSFHSEEVAEFRARELVEQSKRNRSRRKVCPAARKLLGALQLGVAEAFSWQRRESAVTFPEYAAHAKLDPGELFWMVLYGLPTLPPREGEGLARISIPHADRWRLMFAVYVEGLGGDGYVDALASEAHKLRGYPPVPTDAELEAAERDEDSEGATRGR